MNSIDKSTCVGLCISSCRGDHDGHKLGRERRSHSHSGQRALVVRYPVDRDGCGVGVGCHVQLNGCHVGDLIQTAKVILYSLCLTVSGVFLSLLLLAFTSVCLTLSDPVCVCMSLPLSLSLCVSLISES